MWLIWICGKMCFLSLRWWVLSGLSMRIFLRFLVKVDYMECGSFIVSNFDFIWYYVCRVFGIERFVFLIILNECFIIGEYLVFLFVLCGCIVIELFVFVSILIVCWRWLILKNSVRFMKLSCMIKFFFGWFVLWLIVIWWCLCWGYLRFNGDRLNVNILVVWLSILRIVFMWCLLRFLFKIIIFGGYIWMVFIWRIVVLNIWRKRILFFWKVVWWIWLWCILNLCKIFLSFIMELFLSLFCWIIWIGWVISFFLCWNLSGKWLLIGLCWIFVWFGEVVDCELILLIKFEFSMVVLIVILMRCWCIMKSLLKIYISGIEFIFMWVFILLIFWFDYGYLDFVFWVIVFF